MAGNAKQAGGSLKRRSPDEVRVVRASGSVINYEVNHMFDSNTSKTNVIPFKFDSREVRTLVIDDQPWFVASDVAAALMYRDAFNMQRNLDEDEKGTQIVSTPGGDQEMLVINESGLYSAILRSRKAEAKRFKKWVTSEVLPAIRKHGRYEDASSKMATLVNDVIGVSGANLIGGVITQKVSVLPVGVQRQAKHKLHAILHTRFNVPRTELIPADKLDAACEYVAAYVLEGEWIGKTDQKGTLLTDGQLYAVYFLRAHFQALHEIEGKYKLCEHLRAIGSRAGVEMIDHFRDGWFGSRRLNELDEEFEAVQKRMRINHYFQGAAA